MIGFKDNEFKILGHDLNGNSKIVRTYGFAEGVLGTSYEKETMITPGGQAITTTTRGFSGGVGATLGVTNETNSQTGERTTTAGASFGFSIGLGLNVKFEVFIPLITETYKPNK